jgi:hypothetical protein
MTTLGFCTHFGQTDEMAFDLAFQVVKANDWQLTICHWLHSPYRIRRDMVVDDLFKPQEILPVSPKLLNKLEYQLRQYYDPLLEDFTNVAFKLCEGQYQVELARCFHTNLLDVVVMGYPSNSIMITEGGESIEDFAARLAYPLVIVGRDGPESYMVNVSALAWLDKFALPEHSWKVLEPVNAF